jgi:hypothetical protein
MIETTTYRATDDGGRNSDGGGGIIFFIYFSRFTEICFMEPPFFLLKFMFSDFSKFFSSSLIDFC